VDESTFFERVRASVLASHGADVRTGADDFWLESVERVDEPPGDGGQVAVSFRYRPDPHLEGLVGRLFGSVREELPPVRPDDGNHADG
jgi:hypothetical protein